MPINCLAMPRSSTSAPLAWLQGNLACRRRSVTEGPELLKFRIYGPERLDT
jgi:hypothetical protein